MSQITLKKISNHFWYLSPEAAALAFFDNTLLDDIKRKMVFEMNNDVDDINESCPKQFQIKPKEIVTICNKEMDHFITPQSSKFFDRFKINKKFLEVDTSLWSQDENFQRSLNIVQNLKVVNNCAERAVCLIEQHNNILTKNEEQKQFILQVVTDYRKQFPDSKKSTLIKVFK